MDTPLEDARPLTQEPAAIGEAPASDHVAASDEWADAPRQRFRLRPLPFAHRRGFLRLLVETPGDGPRLCIVPAMEQASLIVRHPAGRCRVRAHRAEAAIEPLGLATRALSSLRAMTPLYAKATLRFGPLEVRPDGGRQAARQYRKLVKFAHASGFAFDGETMRRRPELALGFSNAEMMFEARPGPSVAIALHLHYTELWPEIRSLLKRLRLSFSLLISLTRDDAALAKRILGDFPGAEIDVVENKGRDVRPFLQWLESGRLDRFDLVCKIHGKRSLRDGASPLFGELFRRAAFLDLIGDDARVGEICERFAAEPQLGLLGPERFRARSRHGDAAEIMGQSRATIEALAARMGAPIARHDFDVFHGTMFWVRPRALRRLRDLRLAADAFRPEAGLADGALEHAVEGVFNHAVRAEGFKVAGTTAP